jgi:hypothetical protein
LRSKTNYDAYISLLTNSSLLPGSGVLCASIAEPADALGRTRKKQQQDQVSACYRGIARLIQQVQRERNQIHGYGKRYSANQYLWRTHGMVPPLENGHIRQLGENEKTG